MDIPQRFDNSRMVGAIFGLTPRVHASGEVEQVGRTTKCGDAMVRWLLYEAANVMLTRCKTDNWLSRRGMRKARVALARKLAVVMIACGSPIRHSWRRVLPSDGLLAITFQSLRHSFSPID